MRRQRFKLLKRHSSRDGSPCPQASGTTSTIAPLGTHLVQTTEVLCAPRRRGRGPNLAGHFGPRSPVRRRGQQEPPPSLSRSNSGWTLIFFVNQPSTVQTSRSPWTGSPALLIGGAGTTNRSLSSLRQKKRVSSLSLGAQISKSSIRIAQLSTL